MATRNKDNGAMAFHNGTPVDLLNYVNQNATDNDPQSVINAIDDFCWNHHWMMHVGDEKGKILGETVKKCQPLNVLELGTYCGYSMLRMLTNMDNPESKVYTIDPDIKTVTDVTTPILRKAGLLDRVVFLSGYSGDVIKTLSEITFDLVFFDHAKPEYYNDLILLEQRGLVTKTTTLVADNVIVFNIDNYLHYVTNADKFVTTITYTKLEYNSSDKDDKVYTDGVVVSTYIA